MTPERAKFVDELYTAVKNAVPAPSPAGQQLIVAHGCFECGYGRGAAYLKGFNAFNLTAGSHWVAAKKPYWVQPNGDVDGKGRPITQTWRQYVNLEAGVADYWQFLGMTRYAPARNILLKAQPSVFQFCMHLRQGGYFELELGLYTERLTAVYKDVQSYLATPTPVSTPESAP